jgi:hypothetical protein
VKLKELFYSELARPALQPFYDRMIGYLLRLKGFNNFPVAGGSLGIAGEDWLIRRFLPGRVRTVLDIGANQGDFALAVLESTTARVVAVEPIPHLAR